MTCRKRRILLLNIHVGAIRACGKSQPIGYHLGESRQVGGEIPGDTVITSRLTSPIDEPDDEGPVSIEVTAFEPISGSMMRYYLDSRLAPQFHTVLGKLLPMVR
jgi:hypothetical protein